MQLYVTRIGRCASAAGFGGFLVGLLEAAYRGVAIGYSSFLYACLWTLAGIGLGTFLVVFKRNMARGFFRVGFASSLGLSTLVIGRFLLLRDVFMEAPGSNSKATLIAAAVALLLVALTIFGGRMLSHYFAKYDPHPVRNWIPVAVAIIVFGIFAQLPDDDLRTEIPEATAHKGQGVILVIADTLRADALGVYGAQEHRGLPATPHLDAFAQQAAVFTNVGAQASWTKPAVASIMTSRHVAGHNTMSKRSVLPSELPTIATVAKSHNVATAAVVTNYNLEESFGFSHGYDSFTYLAPARYLGAPVRANRLAAYNAIRVAREKLLKGMREARHFYRDGSVVNATGFSFLDDVQAKFFVWLHYMEPHDPYFSQDGTSYARVSDPHPPVDMRDPFFEAYRDDVRRFDTRFGELIEALGARGLLDSTTVVVMSDHGEEFADHGGFYHGVTLYEEQLHVPLMIRGPGIVPGHYTEFVRQIDIAPTIASALGLTPPASWEGRDVFGEAPAPDAMVAEEDHEGNVLRSIRMGDEKLILANQNNPRGLNPLERYDLERDPGEQSPLPTAPVREQALKKQMDKILDQAAKGGAIADVRELDAEAEAELRALGYVE